MPNYKYYLCLLLLFPSLLYAAGTEFLGIDSIYSKPEQITSILPYSINLASSGSRITQSDLKIPAQYGDDLVYLNKVKVNDKIYYRLVMGNYSTQDAAAEIIKKLKTSYPSAWINFRSKAEIDGLSSRLLAVKQDPAPPKPVLTAPSPVIKPVLPSTSRIPASKDVQLAAKLLEDAKQKFIDQNYPRVLAVTGKVEEIGNFEQRQEALELTGIVRERQQQIPQAIAVYNEYLKNYPNSERASIIENRLQGLKTMNFDPKKRMASEDKEKASDWYISGSVSQYYRNDVLTIDTLDNEEVNDSLVSDMNIFVRRKTDTDSLVLRFDGGIVSDFIESSNEGRISRAMVNYTNNEGEYQIIGGRQSRTAKGVLGRFDGFVYKDITNPDFVWSLFTGFPVQSSYDSFDTERVFYGGDISLRFSKEFNMDYYLIQQDSTGLTDRQAIGTEFQYRTDRGFLYGIVDYDLFYKDLNNVTAITNYRHNDQLSFNLTMDHRNSPLLTTTNAIQGQGVDTLDELKTKTGLSDAQIYQLAEDRTSKSSNIYAGSTYIIDDNHQIYLSLALSSIEATKASAATATSPAVAAVEATDNVYISGDYTIRGFFFEKDYTTVGVRVSDTSSSQTTSFRGRSRFQSSRIKNLRYDPRIRIDYRSSKITTDDQYIINPSFKLSYQPTKKLSLEGSVGLEYSNYDIPNRNDQTFYSLFLGYTYQF